MNRKVISKPGSTEQHSLPVYTTPAVSHTVRGCCTAMPARPAGGLGSVKAKVSVGDSHVTCSSANQLKTRKPG